MKKCWNLKPEDRPTFAECTELLEGHLFISSRKLLRDVRKEISSEWEKQKKLATVRIKSVESHVETEKKIMQSSTCDTFHEQINE